MTTDYFQLFNLKSPYTRFKDGRTLTSYIRGWTGEFLFLTQIVEKVEPQIIIEDGSFLGQSAITMAKPCKNQGLQTTIFCVDTWLGSPEHWRNDQCNMMESCFHNFEN